MKTEMVARWLSKMQIGGFIFTRTLTYAQAVCIILSWRTYWAQHEIHVISMACNQDTLISLTNTQHAARCGLGMRQNSFFFSTIFHEIQ